MAGRRSVWNDPRVVEKARSFVTATDEVWRLQRHPDREVSHEGEEDDGGGHVVLGYRYQLNDAFNPSRNALGLDRAGQNWSNRIFRLPWISGAISYYEIRGKSEPVNFISSVQP